MKAEINEGFVVTLSTLVEQQKSGASRFIAEQVLPDTDIAPDQTSPTGEYVCPNCGHHYSETAGEPREGFPAGTPWSAIPDTWRCSDCGVRDKVDYLPVR